MTLCSHDKTNKKLKIRQKTSQTDLRKRGLPSFAFNLGFCYLGFKGDLKQLTSCKINLYQLRCDLYLYTPLLFMECCALLPNLCVFRFYQRQFFFCFLRLIFFFFLLFNIKNLRIYNCGWFVVWKISHIIFCPW